MAAETECPVCWRAQHLDCTRRELASNSIALLSTGDGHQWCSTSARRWRQPRAHEEANKLRVEAAYLILIFTDLLSTPDHLLDPAAAAEIIKTRRGHGALQASIAQLEALFLAESVLKRTEYISLLEHSAPDDRGLVAWPGKPLGEWIAARESSKKRKAKK